MEDSKLAIANKDISYRTQSCCHNKSPNQSRFETKQLELKRRCLSTCSIASGWERVDTLDPVLRTAWGRTRSHLSLVDLSPSVLVSKTPFSGVSKTPFSGASRTCFSGRLSGSYLVALESNLIMLPFTTVKSSSALTPKSISCEMNRRKVVPQPSTTCQRMVC